MIKASGCYFNENIFCEVTATVLDGKIKYYLHIREKSGGNFEMC